MVVKKLEKKIRGKMAAIRRGEVTKKDSNIGVLFNKMKDLDEALYLKLVTEYKDIILKD